MKLQIALLGFLASLPGVASAAPGVGSDLRPLLKVHEERTLVLTTPINDSFHFDDDLLINQDGAFVYQEVLRQFLGDSFRPARTTVAEGAATAAMLADLNRALAAAQIGNLGGESGTLACRLGLKPDEGYVISWYGRTNRATRVIVTPGVADCPAGVATILHAVGVFREAALLTQEASSTSF